MVSKKASKKPQKKAAPVKKTVAKKPVVAAKPAAKPAVKPAVVKTEATGVRKKIMVFPASWDVNEKRQFVSFLFGMILAGFIMWGYVVLDNHRKEERHRERMRIGMEMWARHRQFRKGPHMPPPCAAVKPRKAVFNQAEYAPYAQKGALSLSGSVCAGLPSGVACPKKVMVFVNPVTAYSNEWFNRHWVKNEPLTPPDPRAWQFQRRAVAAENGAFVLKDLPAGAYYVGTNMCVKLKPADSGCTPVRLGAKVTLKKNETVVLKPVFRGKALPPPAPCPCGKRGACNRK